jgi:uncharacterized protein (TIGR00661 family)
MLILGRAFLISGRTIFISPLDWGFGHATRCVPIIHSLRKNNKVIIGVTPLNQKFFEEQFPDLLKIEVPSYNIYYSKRIPVWIEVLIQWSSIKAVVKEEKKCLNRIMQEHPIDLVISDNRFGLYSEKVESIIISHQLNVIAPFLSFWPQKVNRDHIHRFNKVWVPDYADEKKRLSGILSDSSKIKIPVEYIGPLSLLEGIPVETKTEKIDNLILLSGIEPQRSILEKILIEKLYHLGKRTVLIRGKRDASKLNCEGIEVIDFVAGAELKKLILAANRVICRSGYSSLMDLHVLGKTNLVLIPTPGQTEQEYLADLWKKKFNAVSIAQNKVQSFDFK